MNTFWIIPRHSNSTIFQWFLMTSQLPGIFWEPRRCDEFHHIGIVRSHELHKPSPSGWNASCDGLSSLGASCGKSSFLHIRTNTWQDPIALTSAIWWEETVHSRSSFTSVTWHFPHTCWSHTWVLSLWITYLNPIFNLGFGEGVVGSDGPSSNAKECSTAQWHSSHTLAK